MSAPQAQAGRAGPAPARGVALRARRWALLAAALAAGVAGGALFAVLRAPAAPTPPADASIATAPAFTWAAGARLAPPLELDDAHGRPLSLAALRGHPVIVAFIDPLCRNFCPREAQVLSSAVDEFGPRRPTIVSVSVNPWADTAANFHEDALHWRLAPSWVWAVGPQSRLSSVWARYEIGVQVTTRTLAGVTVHEISHTEAAYLIDASGHERALFVYPFSSSAVVAALRRLLPGAP